MPPKFPWLKLRKKTDPETPLEPPIWLGDHSNGEYFHVQTPREAAMKKEILRRADESSRRLGMGRREFLASSMGVFTTFAVINQFGCSSDEKLAENGEGPFVVPPDATCDPAHELSLQGKEFIFDVQTHSFDDGEWRTKNIAYPPFLRFFSRCQDEPVDPLNCLDERHYAELMFLDADTTMAVITSWPAAQCTDERKLLGNEAFACGLPLSNLAMRNMREWLNKLSKSERLINQVQVMPNDVVEKQIEGMHAAMTDPTWRCGSWKLYPAWRSDTYPNAEGHASGFFLTDPIGVAVIEAGLKLGVPNFAVHKGLPIPGFDVEHNKPTDIGPIAKMFPEANFVIYHSAICAGLESGRSNLVDSIIPPQTENVPYDAKDPNPLGVNMLIRSLIENGLIDDPDNPTGVKARRLNVFAEMGTAWLTCMTNPVTAQHYVGKLLKYLGPDNIVWGTDSILVGSPQGQIQAFRTFTITEEYQERFGYPALTAEMKAKIFGLNAAKLYRIDPDRKRCVFEKSDLAQLKRDMDGELGPNRWAGRQPLGPRTLEEFAAHARAARAKGVPG
jgi:predicted TIM-barrel fold metal-dependent hydrolase